jgi:nitrogen fixation protein NifX
MGIIRRLTILSTNPGNPGDTVLRVAFATTDMKHVDQHFGAAQSFAIYAVGPHLWRLEEACEFAAPGDSNEDKLADKLTLIENCAAVYCNAIGASAIRALLGAGVQPVKVSEGAAIAALVEDLQSEMREGPTAWVAKAIAATSAPQPGRFDHMDAEGWDE